MPQEDVPAANRYIIRQQLNNLRDGKRRLVDAKQQLWQAVQSQEVKDAFGVDYPRLVQAIQDV